MTKNTQKEIITREQALALFKKEHPEYRIVASHEKRLLFYEEVKRKREIRTQKENKIIKELAKKGIPLREIAHKVGMTYEGVRQRIINYG